MLPGLGLELLDSPWFDRTFALSVALFGLVVLGAGLCGHRLRLVGFLYLTAVALLCVGAFGIENGAGILRGAVLATGGACMATAHFVNRAGVRLHGCARNLWRELFTTLWSPAGLAKRAES